MSTTLKEWADATWNPTSGCEQVSPGCEHCYAIPQTNRFKDYNPKFAGTIKKTKGGKLNWSGKINLHQDLLTKPSEWKSPKRIFVGSMSDLFHPDISFRFIERVFDQMAESDWHTFMVLTKRPERMLRFWEYYAKCELLPFDKLKEHLPNVWLGCSVENQQEADKRIPLILEIPAAIRFLSCEPLLGSLDLRSYFYYPKYHCSNCGSRDGVLATAGNEFEGIECVDCDAYMTRTPDSIDWVIAGGESGHKARPMHPKWLRTIRDHCDEAKVPFFFKQWGKWLPFTEDVQAPFWRAANTGELYDRHGMNFLDHDDPMNPGRWQGFKWMSGDDVLSYHLEDGLLDVNYLNVGSKRSGRLLDGKTWHEFPRAQQEKTTGNGKTLIPEVLEKLRKSKDA